jgi:hypothetical protein
MTWRNNRADNSSVSKLIDRFQVSDNFLQGVDRYRSWIDQNRCSYHNPILLELEYSNPKLGTPFKFNHGYLEEYEFHYLVKDV